MSRVIMVRGGSRRSVIKAGMRGAPGADGEGGGGSAGVASFNTRTGIVTLTGADVTDALGYVPADGASLATVAFSGSYPDLADKPFIPSAPGDVGAASSAQGALADTAVQPAALAVQLNLKVDKITGYGLSQENFTPAEKAKLAGLDGNLWKGEYTTLVALQSAHPTAEPGSSANVDAGIGDPVLRYIWDDNDNEWVAQAGSADPITAAQVKTLYESNPDTNAYTDAEKTKLGDIAANATANPDTDSLSEGATNKWFTDARVRAAVLTGLSMASAAAVSATDNVLVAFGKLQKQITDLIATVSGKQDTLVSATNIKTINGASVLGAGDLTVGGLANPMTTAGDVIVAGAAGAPARLAIGTEGQVPVVRSGTLVYEAQAGDTVPFAPVVADATTVRTLAITDAGNYLRFTNAAATVCTVAPQASVTWAAYTEVHVRRVGAGNLTLTPGAGVTLNAPSGGTLVLTAGMSVTLKRVTADEWDVIGQTVAA